MTRFGVGLTLTVFVVMLAIWNQSYEGRKDVVNAQRAACLRGAENLASQVNEDRITQADNATTSTTRGVPSIVRQSKRRTIRHQEALIRVLDTHIDSGQWRLLDHQVDRRLVKRGSFTCAGAYPAATPFQFGVG